MRRTLRPLLMLFLTLGLVQAVQARDAFDEFQRRVMSEVMQSGDVDLGQAMSVVIGKGYLKRLYELSRSGGNGGGGQIDGQALLRAMKDFIKNEFPLASAFEPSFGRLQQDERGEWTVRVTWPLPVLYGSKTIKSAVLAAVPATQQIYVRTTYGP